MPEGTGAALASREKSGGCPPGVVIARSSKATGWLPNVGVVVSSTYAIVGPGAVTPTSWVNG